MFILSLEKGYAQIEDVSEEVYVEPHYVIIEYPNGPLCKLTIGRRTENVHIIPTGQIAIDVYNENQQKYLDGGGTVEELLKAYKSGKWLISLEPLYAHFWPFSQKPPKEQDLSDLDFSILPYIKVCFIQYMGEQIPVFSVEELSDLYYYDLYRLKTSRKIVRACEDCGKAFFAHTTAVRCDDCRKAGAGEKKKRDNLNRDLAKKQIKRIMDRDRRRSKDRYHYQLLDQIREARDRMAKGEFTQEEFEKRIKEIDELDEKYMRLKRRIDSAICCMPEYMFKRWKDEGHTMFIQDDPEKWLKEWYKRAKLDY